MNFLHERQLGQALPLFKVLAIILIVFALSAILMVGKEVLLPVALALLLSFALSPVVSGFQRLGLSKGLAVMGTILIAAAIIGIIGFITFRQFSNFAQELPKYRSTIVAKTKSLSNNTFGENSLSASVTSVISLFDEMKSEITKTDDSFSQKPTPVVLQKESNTPFSAMANVLSPVVYPLLSLVSIFLLVGFMLAEREDLRNRLIALMGTDDIQQTTALIDEAGTRISSMLLMQLIVNACFALIIGLGLWLIGLPSAFLWGLLAGITRFVPYIGTVIGVVPPVLVSFVVDPSWNSMFWTIILFTVVESIVNNIIEPLLYRKSTGLSPVAVIISAMIWGFLWGPIGLILATPLTICLVVLGRHLGGMKSLDTILGDRPVLKPHEIFYQRMLARDPLEAVQQAKAFVRDRSLAAYYDAVALAAIRRAHLDIVRGRVTGERLQALIDTTSSLLRSLDRISEGSILSRRLAAADAETMATFEAAGETQAEALHAFTTDKLPMNWRGKNPVLVMHGDHPLDVAAATMLAQVFTRLGLGAVTMGLTAPPEMYPQAREEIALVCLSFIEPRSTLHLRAISRQVHRQLPRSQIILCLWQEMDPALVAELASKLRVNGVATTMTETIQRANRMISAQLEKTKVTAQ